MTALLRASWVALIIAWTGAPAAQTLPPLFTSPERASAAAAAALATPSVVSATSVGIRFEALFDHDGRPANRVRLNLGTDDWIARLERVDVDDAGFRSWVGALEQDPQSHVVFTVRDGVVSGLINSPAMTLQVRTVGPGVHLIEQIATERLGIEHEPLALPAAAGASAAPDAAADGSGLIDVLVLYTPAARQARGGAPQIAALVAQIISDSNTIFARSGVTARFRLAGSGEYAFVESASMMADLQMIARDPAVRARRDSARADLVHVLVSSPDLANCGFGHLLTVPDAVDFDAYSVADVACIAQYTPTHEMAHNFGSHHAPDETFGGGLFSYSYGFKSLTHRFRTVMATQCGVSPCQRIPNMSNPGVPHQGAATGTSFQNNARSMNNVAAVVASWRSSGVAPPLPPQDVRVAMTSTHVTLSWEPAPGGAPPASYIIDVGSGPSLTDLLSQDTGSPSPSYTAPLPAAGNYYVRVRARGAGGVSAPSGEVVVTVPAAGGCSSPPAPPRGLGASVGGNQVTLGWESAPSVSGHVLEAGSAPGLANLLVLPLGAAPGFSAAAPPGLYHVRVRASNACGTSPPSNEIVVAVPGA